MKMMVTLFSALKKNVAHDQKMKEKILNQDCTLMDTLFKKRLILKKLYYCVFLVMLRKAGECLCVKCECLAETCFTLVFFPVGVFDEEKTSLVLNTGRNTEDVLGNLV